ncbi:glycoside hydrolase family 76 protein [Niabella aurantiaca]|uniref:glycoside hydrolase family 76 protein n=1 Tax=Niabella aurantiaca TaxID=379900 RepID=UPI0003711C90|nr:glycoside hydrolase family 76 protein [Niabella aurantiaca]
MKQNYRSLTFSINYTISCIALIIAGLLQSCAKEQFPLYPPEPGSGVKENHDWSGLADSLQDVLYQTYRSPDGRYFMQNNTGNQTFHYWWNAHAMDVLADAHERTGAESYKTRMQALLSGIKNKNGNSLVNNFYDDMEWLALSSLRAFGSTQDPVFKDAAVLLWNDIKTGENTTMGGGIAWNKNQLYYKNTPANAPAIILAARLYQLDKKQEDLDAAVRLYTWLKQTLLDPVSGLAWDGINSKNDEAIDKNLFTYNQGTFVGAALELYNATQNAAYLNDAVRTAKAAISNTSITPSGILKSEGQGDGGLFKGILVRYFTRLALNTAVADADKATIIAFLKANAVSIYQKGMARPGLLINSDWTARPPGSIDLSTQLSGMMMIEAAALLKKNSVIE